MKVPMFLVTKYVAAKLKSNGKKTTRKRSHKCPDKKGQLLSAEPHAREEQHQHEKLQCDFSSYLTSWQRFIIHSRPRICKAYIRIHNLGESTSLDKRDISAGAQITKGLCMYD